jgi:AmmeMemoRadiSam system protein A
MDRGEQDRLLGLARRVLNAGVRGEPLPAPECGGVLDDHCAAFVSIHKQGDLRGCLGRLDAGWPLSRLIAHLSFEVAHADPRFTPVQPAELELLDLELSILTPEREIGDLTEIVIGRHGVIVESGGRRALLLPQVAVEYGWDARAFVEHTCLKAGLRRDAWRDGRIYAFEAEVFGEHDRDAS